MKRLEDGGIKKQNQKNPRPNQKAKRNKVRSDPTVISQWHNSS